MVERAERDQGVSNLEVLGFQPFERMSQVLGSADVLMAILEPDAGVFSVPSKVLTYHCASRPLLVAIPSTNLGARIVTRHRTGLAVTPHDLDGFVQQGRRLLEDASLREDFAGNARRYAKPISRSTGLLTSLKASSARGEAVGTLRRGRRAGQIDGPVVSG